MADKRYTLTITLEFPESSTPENVKGAVDAVREVVSDALFETIENADGWAEAYGPTTYKVADPRSLGNRLVHFGS